MSISTRNVITPILLGLLAAASALGDMPENYLTRWNDPAVQNRIDDGIEKNRKGDALLQIVGPDGRPVADAEVTVTQTSHAFLFGCNIFVLGQMKEKNQAYEDAFLKLFNFATVPLYWGDLEPERDKPRFAEGSSHIWRRPPPDRVVAFGKKHGLTLKGHPLLWHSINPKWMPKEPDQLKRFYIKRFKELADRYAEDIPLWEGVNESLVCKPDFPFFSARHKNHPPYVPWAFAEQHKVFGPKNQLLINEVAKFNWPSDKTNRYYQQCAKLLEDGVGIQGIGFQFHFMRRKSLEGFLGDGRCDPGTLLDAYAMFARLGLPLWITEITIGSAGDDGPEIQARVVRDMYRLWFSSPDIAGITWWNLGDGTAFGTEGGARGGLSDENLKPKPAYKALDQLINRDWKTNLETKSDAVGNVKFRGFLGKYSVRVAVGDSVEQFEINLGKDSQEPFTLTLK